MDIFINQNASKFFIDFLLCVLLKSGTRFFFVLARVCSYCAGVNDSLRIRHGMRHGIRIQTDSAEIDTTEDSRKTGKTQSEDTTKKLCCGMVALGTLWHYGVS